jgi:PAS domain S-box-containing protein
MSNVRAQTSSDIVISLDGLYGPSIGCFMVDNNLKLIWHNPFISNWPVARGVSTCYELFGKDQPCQDCAAKRAFLSGSPETCEQLLIDSKGRKSFYHVVGSPIRDRGEDGARYLAVIQDITARMETEQEYRRVNELNYNIIYNAPVGIFTLNQHGVITSTNPAHLKIAGNPPLDKLLGYDWLNSPNVISSGLAHYLKMGLSGKSFKVADFEFTANLTGRKLFMTIKGVPLRDKKGKIQGLLCIIEDTTEKTKYLVELERLKRINENIIHSITNGIMVINKDMKLLTWNDGMEAIFGIKATKALKLPFQKCLQEIGLSRAIKQIDNGLKSGQSYAVEKFGISLPSKGYISVNYKIMPLFDEHRSQFGVILFFEDITQKEKYEIKYQTLFNEAKDGIIVIQKNGGFLSANPMALELLQRSWEGLEKVNFQKLVWEEDIKRIKTILSQGSEREIQPFELRLVLPTQEYLTVEISVSRVRERDKTVALQMIMRDVRERIKLEKQLFQASRLSGLGELAAGVAHEINNPLATIAGYAEEVLDLLSEWNSKPGLDQDQISELELLVKLIRDQSYRCKEITRNLLDFSCVKPPCFQFIDLNEIILNTLSFVRNPGRGGNGRIQLSLNSDLPLLKTDYSQIQQVFLNVLKNALDATEKAGNINIITTASAYKIAIIFRDTGIGMTPQELDRMFDPFFTTKPSDKGTGLGLSISYRIVEQLGGEIQVESQKGEGTTFSIIFPRDHNGRTASKKNSHH